MNLSTSISDFMGQGAAPRQATRALTGSSEAAGRKSAAQQALLPGPRGGDAGVAAAHALNDVGIALSGLHRAGVVYRAGHVTRPAWPTMPSVCLLPVPVPATTGCRPIGARSCCKPASPPRLRAVHVAGYCRPHKKRAGNAGPPQQGAVDQRPGMRQQSLTATTVDEFNNERLRNVQLSDVIERITASIPKFCSHLVLVPVNPDGQTSAMAVPVAPGKMEMGEPVTCTHSRAVAIGAAK